MMDYVIIAAFVVFVLVPFIVPDAVDRYLLHQHERLPSAHRRRIGVAILIVTSLAYAYVLYAVTKIGTVAVVFAITMVVAVLQAARRKRQ